MHYAVINSPMGPLTLAVSDKGLASIKFGNAVPEGAVPEANASQETVDQLTEYFQGKRTQFDLPLDIEGTDFQKAVWSELQRIPYGETRSYGDIAKAIGRPGAARAVGMANHDNPLAVVIPCHRVVGRDGSLTGYAGGVHLKAQLLSIERRHRTLFT
ncbi:MAG TPA: methylated-DNA--[protein]-cysteine S-methyltransferase [Terriglobia bacterium]|nr:methylated-DNA--[protein]-cysteine S-methyltransferase [Terriglobia bacterium]